MVQFLSIIFFSWISSIFVGFFKSSRFFCVILYYTKMHGEQDTKISVPCFPRRLLSAKTTCTSLGSVIVRVTITHDSDTHPLQLRVTDTAACKRQKYRTIILPVVLYGCETWSLTLREEHRLRVFEYRVLRRIFGPKRDEVTGEW